MRMSRRLALNTSTKLRVLSKGSWDFQYGGRLYTWNTNVQANPDIIYYTGSPTVDNDGVHIFTNTINLNQVVAAVTPIAIDIRKYSTIRVLYDTWLNNSWAYRSTIELLPENSEVYWANYSNDICIVHANASTPGEIVYTIPDTAKQTNPMRKLWIKAVKNYYESGVVQLKIRDIILER